MSEESERDDELPYALKKRPESRYQWDFPTAWLLGTRLIGSLRDMAATSVFDFDPRDWMSPGKPIDLDRPEHLKDGAFWLDFLADSGDSPRLVYQLACLLQQPSLEVFGTGENAHAVLPARLLRGSALVFGGDTAYPIASRRRLLERMRAPFTWAMRDLEADEALHPASATRSVRDQSPVHLFGIPGNHDYYNALAGFERQFHRRDMIEPDLTERVSLPGYEVAQQSSYFALNLPHGWQFWGLDVEVRKLDGIQKRYFLEAAACEKDGARYDKRIVATSRPTVANHAVTKHAIDESGKNPLSDTFSELGLSLAFANGGRLGDRELARLDLSGDVHLYERYWGTDQRTAFTGEPRTKLDGFQRPFPGADAPSGAQSRSNYASVVSGLGGAFHHPSQVRERPRPEPVTPRRAWPGNAASEMEIGARLLRPRKLFQAGAVGVIGILIALLTFATGRGNPLDIPFDLHGCSKPLSRLLIVASIAGTFGVLGVASFLLLKFGKKLHEQIQDMGPPRNFWGITTHWVSHGSVSRWLLRWAGVNHRNAWGVLLTFPAWGLVAVTWYRVIDALVSCGHLGQANDDFTRSYVTSIALIAFLAVLGGIKLHGRYPVIGGIFGFSLGALTAVLILWTPYAWTRLILSEHRVWALSFFGYWIVRHFVLRGWFFGLPIGVRRLTTVVAFSAVIALYTLVPGYLLHGHIRNIDLPWWSRALSAALAAYLSCLWLGWYFFVCLQWNAHGNEAGGAARVVSFGEFMRIKLTKERAEVWVIGVDGPSTPRRSVWKPCSPPGMAEALPVARLIDHFTVEAVPHQP